MANEQEFSASAVGTVTPPATVEEETQTDA